MQLKITLKSAQVFKSVGFLSKMHLYAVATVVGGPSSSPPQRTTTDMHGGAKPFWWFPMEFEIGDEPKLVMSDASVVVCIKCRRSIMIGANKSVGAVHLPVKALLDYYLLNLEGNQPANIAVTILSPSGKPRGVLYLSYMFGDGAVCGGATPLCSLLPRSLRPVPSAPPLQDHEDWGDQKYYQKYDNVVVPSAPYLPEEYMSH